jgi:hypothetical protein
MNNCFYTYAYLREDKTPFYIGKGKGNRAYDAMHKPVGKPPKERILILKNNLTETEAFKHEIYMISVFGRKDNGTGILRNRSDGGEKSRAGGIGNFRTGTKHTEKTKKLIGSYHKGKIVSQETKEKLKKANIGKKWWNNGVQCKHTFDCPGPEWKLGRVNFKISAPKKQRENMKARMRKQYTFIDPQDNIITEYLNLKEISEKYNLSYKKLHLLVKGKQKTHKKWRFLNYVDV